MLTMAKKKNDVQDGEKRKVYPSRAKTAYAGMKKDIYQALAEVGQPFERSVSYLANLGAKLILAWSKVNPGRSPDMLLDDFKRFLGERP